MSVYGDWKNATISAGGTITSAINLGRDYDYVSLQIPSMTPCKLSLRVAEMEGGTYYSLGSDTTTDEETFNRADVWRLGGYQFIKIVASKPQMGSVTIRVRGMRY